MGISIPYMGYYLLLLNYCPVLGHWQYTKGNFWWFLRWKCNILIGDKGALLDKRFATTIVYCRLDPARERNDFLKESITIVMFFEKHCITLRAWIGNAPLQILQVNMIVIVLCLTVCLWRGCNVNIINHNSINHETILHFQISIGFFPDIYFCDL